MGPGGIRLAAIGLALAPACLLEIEPPGDPVDAAAPRDGASADAAPSDAVPLQTIERRVAASDDDAEQQPDESMYIDSTDLELVEETAGGAAQIVGMRFRDLGIEPGASIEAAHLQFEVDEVSSVDTSLVLLGEAADDAAPFSTTAGDLAGRALTAMAVSWSPPPWELVGEAGEDHRTPDLSPVVQEVVDRPGWQAGNAMVLLVTGSGKRVAKSYDGFPDAAPLLHVEFRSP